MVSMFESQTQGKFSENARDRCRSKRATRERGKTPRTGYPRGAVGFSVSSVQRIWRAYRLQPHRVRQFKLSKDPEFTAKLRDVVGLCRSKRGAGTMTHDYKRHGTTTLFAAFNVLDGTVIRRNMQRHRHQEFIRFSPIVGWRGAWGSNIADRPLLALARAETMDEWSLRRTPQPELSRVS